MEASKDNYRGQLVGWSEEVNNVLAPFCQILINAPHGINIEKNSLINFNQLCRLKMT